MARWCSKRVLSVLLGFSVTSSLGNGYVAHARGDERVAALAPALIERPFAYRKTVIRPRNHVEASLETMHYRVRSEGNLVTGLYYQSKLPGKKRLVIVLPIWGTHTYPPRKITQSLLRYSGGQINVFRLFGKEYLLDWQSMRSAPNAQAFIALIEQTVKRVKAHVIDIRRFIDWAETQSDIDANRIGLIGFSMGATVGSLIMAHEPRIAASALVMGGAHPHEMFATCFGRAQQTRNTLMSRFGWTAEIFKKKIEKPFAPINPANYSGKANPNQIIIFEARYDTCVPKSSREAFWQAMGKPKRVSWPYDHKSAFLTMTILGLNTMRRRIYRFLEAML